MQEKFSIKNMVCPRCIAAVKEIFDDLELATVDISLGSATVKEMPDNKVHDLKRRLKEAGFELLDDRNTRLINQIKSIIIDLIHYQDNESPINISALLSAKLYYEYSYLSRLFSTVEGRTIEKFVLAQKTERVKELLAYDEMTLSEIAAKMHYSSIAHLSSQFKKVTGMSPSDFKKQIQHSRNSLDAL